MMIYCFCLDSVRLVYNRQCRLYSTILRYCQYPIYQYIDMTEHFSLSFEKPDHIFIRKKAKWYLYDREFVAGQLLFYFVTNIIQHHRYVNKKDLDTFSILVSSIRPILKIDLVINQVLFQGIMIQISTSSFPDGAWSPFAVIFDLLNGAVNLHPPLNRPPPLSQKEVTWGLIFAYDSRGVKPRRSEHAILNYHFHYFASSLYFLNVIDDPIFFVSAMRDALETSWNNAQHCDWLFNSVAQWVICCGEKLLLQIRNGYQTGNPRSTLYHGKLYELEL
ncbi:hypothetical protein F5Y11DRAFT_102265 [Daldinia sp. FL1419]|nr:hypothetical protein F5Y11DRAFT_102265 [Daldinia sp. FL1419]